jgi:hypothetical protein
MSVEPPTFVDLRGVGREDARPIVELGMLGNGAPEEGATLAWRSGERGGAVVSVAVPKERTPLLTRSTRTPR